MCIKKCPNCNHELLAIDTLGMFSFEMKFSRVFWLVAFIFLILLWSILVPKIVPEDFVSIALLVYYSLAALMVYKAFKSNMNKIVYGCVSCKKRFKGDSLTSFNYAEKN